MNRKISMVVIGLVVVSVMILSGSAHESSISKTEEKIATEADYILSCQYTKHPQHPAYGAINNIYGDPTWVVPRENAMAILGLIVASEVLNNESYREKAQLAADYLIKIQDPSDGAWYDQYSYTDVVDHAKSPTQTAEVMIALYKLGYDHNRYNAMKNSAKYLIECQKVENKRGKDDGLLGGGKDASGQYHNWRWTHDNAYAYRALKAAEVWATIADDMPFASECAYSAQRIIEGINASLYNPITGVWHIAIDENGAPQWITNLSNLPSWIQYAPHMLDLPANGVNSSAVGEWIHNTFQQNDSSCIGYVWENGVHKRKYPGLAFQAALCWFDTGHAPYATDTNTWAENSGLWQTTPDQNGITGGWIDWVEIEPTEGMRADWWLRFIDTSFYAIASWNGGYDFKVSPNYVLIYTSQNLSGHSVYPECNPGGETNCSDSCSGEDVSITSFEDYGEVTSNVRERNIYVNAIGYKKFIETFPNRDSIDLRTYKYTGQVKLPVCPSDNVSQIKNPQAVHMMIQLWDGRESLWDSNNNTLEGTIYWDLNPWTQDGKNGTIKIYTKPMILTPITNLTPDTNRHTFELVVNLTSKRYISMTIDGKLTDLSTYELAQVYHGPESSEPWGKDISLIITTESLAAWPGENCTNVFTWTTQFKDLEFSAMPTPTPVFDTDYPYNPYPSIMGNHTGIIKPNHTVIATKLYTYPCTGTGGHTEYVRIYNETGTLAVGHWKGYQSGYHDITLIPSITLLKDHEYNYTIITGSYPQIHHTDRLETDDGIITCVSFVDANGKRYNDWIPAIRFE